MTPQQLREGRNRAGLTQKQAAKRLGLSQPYLSQLENGRRKVTPRLARKAVRRLRMDPTGLDLPADPPPRLGRPGDLARRLGAVGYPGFAHLRAGEAVNPARLVLEALSHDDLDARVTAALPWVLLRYADLEWPWLLREVKARSLQNRLGLLVAAAREAGRGRPRWEPAARRLESVEADLDRSRLVAESTLCREGMPAAERKWLRRHRPALARHWNVLTSLTPESLPHVA